MGDRKVGGRSSGDKLKRSVESAGQGKGSPTLIFIPTGRLFKGFTQDSNGINHDKKKVKSPQPFDFDK